MKRFFCVTIDVEPDCTVSWKRSNPLTFENVKTGILKILQPLFQEYSVRPTYLISPEVMNDFQSVALLSIDREETWPLYRPNCSDDL